MAAPSLPQLRMMHAGGMPPVSPPQLVVYGDQQPRVPRPATAPLPLVSGPVHPFNVPPPRQLPRWSSLDCYLSCFV